MATKTFDLVGFVMAYEGGEASDDEIIEGFQHLIDTGDAWKLQGSYGRMANALIVAGHCSPPASSRVEVPEPKPEKVGTHCECGAGYVYLERLNSWGYACAR